MSAIPPPDGVSIGDGWTPEDLRDGDDRDEEFDPTTAKPEGIDWHTSDGRLVTWDSENEQWLQCNVPKKGGGTETLTWDPDAKEWTQDAYTPNPMMPFGIYNEDNPNDTQGWSPTKGGAPIDPKDLGLHDPKSIKWTAGEKTIEWDPKKEVWVKKGEGADQYYDPRHPRHGIEFGAYPNKGNPTGWNDLAYYEQYQENKA